ncbi:hypothetical protein AB0E81_19305 [Streptomyces sp. NPDC033538]|uniref:hypothetical protein n=1 Tax=Streptomyces sp. NPDC033538 TaxID=3155367 RepID=UPI0033FAB073
MVGAVGLSVADAPTEVARQVVINRRLGRMFWGQGYTSEAAHATPDTRQARHADGRDGTAPGPRLRPCDARHRPTQYQDQHPYH